MQDVRFKIGSEKEALQKAKLKKTHLTAWFELNKTDVEARKYFYYEIPEYYVFEKKKNANGIA